MPDQSFDDWAAGRPDPRFTDWLREQAQPLWTQAVTHRFVRDLADDTLPDAVMARYLVQDYSFLDHFVRLVGSAVAKAPTLAERLPLCRFLAVVTSDENTYFHRAFDTLGVSEAERTAPDLRQPTRGFHAVMADAVAAKTYGETLVPLVVFEWLYLDWASAVADRRPGKFYFREWIDLHANPDFVAFVDWLRRQLDAAGPELLPRKQNTAAEVFRHTVELEKAFFDEAFVETPPTP
ncbi:MAG: transcriptional regulator [Rhodospirillales bacterium]|nr:MAG: transcriptional regulator [Rhodospirillales bacterium]